MPLVEILSIGTELILGRIADTNAQWLAQQIEQVGSCVRQVTTMRDDPDEITAVIHEAIERGATHIITTGGLVLAVEFHMYCVFGQLALA